MRIHVGNGVQKRLIVGVQHEHDHVVLAGNRIQAVFGQNRLGLRDQIGVREVVHAARLLGCGRRGNEQACHANALHHQKAGANQGDDTLGAESVEQAKQQRQRNDGDPHNAGNNHHGVVLGPHNSAAVGNGHAIVQHQNLNVRRYANAGNQNQEEIEDAASQGRQQKREHRHDSDGRQRHNPPHVSKREHQRTGTAANNLARGNHEDSAHHEGASQKRVVETRAPRRSVLARTTLLALDALRRALALASTDARSSLAFTGSAFANTRSRIRRHALPIGAMDGRVNLATSVLVEI